MKALFFTAALLFSSSAFAVDPKAVVQGKVKEIQAIVATDTTDAGVRQKVTVVFESFTDFTEFSKQTLKSTWEKLTPKQQAVFVDTYRRLLHKSYIKHFKANQPLVVTFRGEAEVIGDKANVPTTVTSGGTKADVDYRMISQTDTYRVYDLVIDEVSLMRSYRKQFTKIYDRDGFDALIKKLEERIAKGDGKVEEED